MPSPRPKFRLLNSKQATPLLVCLGLESWTWRIRSSPEWLLRRLRFWVEMVKCAGFDLNDYGAEEYETWCYQYMPRWWCLGLCTELCRQIGVSKSVAYGQLRCTNYNHRQELFVSKYMFRRQSPGCPQIWKWVKVHGRSSHRKSV